MKKPFNLFLLIGQSNMAGRGLLNAVPPLRHPNVRMFRQGQWLSAEEPLHTDKPAIAGIGLGMSFAITLLERQQDQVIGLIPCAVGGTRLERWVPGGDLYMNALAVSRQAEQGNSLKGVLWHQGEGDCGAKENAENYGARLRGMIEGLRVDLNAPELPFVLGELGEFLEDRDSCSGLFRVINRQIRACGEQLSDVGWVSASGLKDNGDNLHFDSVSLREFGRRYAVEYQKIKGRS